MLKRNTQPRKYNMFYVEKESLEADSELMWFYCCLSERMLTNQCWKWGQQWKITCACKIDYNNGWSTR